MPHRPFSQLQYNPFRQPSESAPEDSAPWPAHLPAPPRRPPRCNKAESRITRNQISFPSPIQTLESAFCHEMPVWGRAPSPVPPSAAKRAPPQLRKATGFNPPKRIAGRLQPTSTKPLLRQPRQPIHTPPVLLLPIRLQPLRPLLPCPGRKLFPLPLILEPRNAVSARIINPRDFHQNNRPDAFISRELGQERSEFSILRFHRSPVPMHPQNVRRPLKRAEHQGDPPILLQMSDGLDAASVEIQVSDGGRTENPKRVQPLGREVHVARRIQRGRSNKKHALLLNEPRRQIVEC